MEETAWSLARGVPVRRQSLGLAAWAGKPDVCHLLCVHFRGRGAGRSDPRIPRRGSKWRGGALGVSVQPIPTGPQCRRHQKTVKKQDQAFCAVGRRSVGTVPQMYPRGRLGWGGPIKAGHFPTERDKLQL